MNRRGSRIKGWFTSLGIGILSVLIVGSILGTVMLVTTTRTSRVSTTDRPKSIATRTEPTSQERGELSRKIAESFRRQAAPASNERSKQVARVPVDESPPVRSATTGPASAPMTGPDTEPESSPRAESTVSAPRSSDGVIPRTATQILDELNRDRIGRTKGRSPRADQASRDDEDKRRAELIGELYRIDPKRSQLPNLLIERWLTLRDDADAKTERESAAARPRGDAVGDAAAYVAARLAVEDPAVDGEQALRRIGAFGARTRNRSSRISQLLGTLADRMTDAADRREIYQRIVALFPDSRDAELAIRRLAQLDEESFREVVDSAGGTADPAVGKRFEFALQDVVSGDLISSDALRGRIMVIDFWATWCGPCVAAMPRMKELHAKYGPRGVAFIGISLDQTDSAGQRKLLKFVSENEVRWPQLQQKDRELQALWNVTSIPTIFVVDGSGRIISKNGDLDRILSNLLAHAATPKRR